MENPTSPQTPTSDQQLGLDTFIEGLKAQRGEAMDLAAHLNAEIAILKRKLEEAVEKKEKAKDLAKQFRGIARNARTYIDLDAVPTAVSDEWDLHLGKLHDPE